jgi:hypothetical protein
MMTTMNLWTAIVVESFGLAAGYRSCLFQQRTTEHQFFCASTKPQ